MTKSDPTTPTQAGASETGFVLATLAWTLQRDPFGKLYFNIYLKDWELENSC